MRRASGEEHRRASGTTVGRAGEPALLEVDLAL